MATDNPDTRGCRPAQAAKVRQARDEIQRHRAVAEPVDILPPEEGPLPCWTLDIVAECEGPTAPASLFRRLTCRGVVPYDLQRQGPDHHQILAVWR